MTGVLEEKLGVQELIQDFIESLEVEKGRSRKTAENYERYLLRFLEMAGEISGKDYDLEPEDITQELLRKFRLKLNRLESRRTV